MLSLLSVGLQRQVRLSELEVQLKGRKESACGKPSTRSPANLVRDNNNNDNKGGFGSESINPDVCFHVLHKDMREKEGGRDDKWGSSEHVTYSDSSD